MAGLNSAQIRDRARERGINLSDQQVQSILEQAWDQSQWGADEGSVMSILGSYGGGSSGVSGPSSAEDLINQLKAEMQAQIDEYNKRNKDFDTANPFSFDEMQARSSSEERYNPYYEAELSDVLGGIERQRESAEGEKSLLMDLNRIQAGAEKRNLEEAIRASEEGFAGAGLYFSGAKERSTGMETIAGKEQTEERTKRFDFSQDELGRRMEGLAASEKTGRRTIGAEQTTAIESDVAKQKAEALARRQEERQAYVGYPYYTSSTTGVNQLLDYL